MLRLSLTTSLTLFVLGLCLCQTYVYPVKVDHKWGYINARGKLIVPPRYEQIAHEDLPWHGKSILSESSDFRLVENDQKLGLIDPAKNEVLSTNYKEIKPLSASFFMVEIDSLYTVVNRDENVLLNERFENIHLLGHSKSKAQNYFSVKQGNYWGVYNDSGQPILPISYDTICFIDAGRGYFKVKKGTDKLWGLVDLNDKLIFPYTYLNIDAYHDNFIATYKMTGRWEAWDSLGARILQPEWSTFKPLNQHLMLISRGGSRNCLYAFAQKDTIPLENNYKAIDSLDARFVKFKINGRWGILDSLGQQVLGPTYISIRAGTDGFYRVFDLNRWGLYDMKKGLILSCEYTNILDFQGRYAIVYKREGAGIIDIKMKEIIPPIYDSLRLEGDIYKGFQGSSITLIELDDKSNVIRMDDYNNVRTITIGKRRNKVLKEARPIKRRKIARSPTHYIDSYTSPGQIEGSPWRWYNDKLERKWGLKAERPDQSIPPVFRSVKHVGNGRLSLVYTFQDPVSNSFAEWAAAPMDTLCRMGLFSHNQGKWITANDFTGLRRHDFERDLPYAAMIDTEGKFGLINRNGEQAKDKSGQPLRFTYIGEFEDGKAKVCVNGKLKNMEDPSNLKYTLEEREVFLIAYGLLPTIPTEHRLKEGRILLEIPKDEKLKWGFVDTLGNFVIEPQYEFALDFTAGQAVVVKDNNWGVVDENNETVIDFEYGSISDFYGQWRINKRVKGAIFFDKKGQQLAGGDYQRRGQFRNGYCQVMQNDKWGFIDERGKLVIPCEYDAVHNFSQQMVAVRKKGSWSFLNPKGEVVINLAQKSVELDTLSDFNNGLCWFKHKGKYGYLNTKGDVHIPAKFIKAFGFRHGVARIVENRRTGLIDTAGNYVLPAKRFERIDRFNEWGVATVMESFRSGKKGLINAKGEVLTDVKYKIIEPFKEGLAIASTDGKLFTLLNTKGEEIIPQDYETIGEVSGGLIPVKKKKWEPWVYINSKGEQAFEGKFEVVSPFKGQYAEVQEKRFDPETRQFIDRTGTPFNLFDGKVEFFENGIAGVFVENPPKRRLNYCYTDARGKPLYNQYFQDIEPFVGENAQVKRNWRFGFINKRGFMIVRPKYIVLQRLEADMILARPPAFGICNRSGKIVLPAQYDHIELLTGRIYRVEQGEKVGYVREDGKWIWELQN